MVFLRCSVHPAVIRAGYVISFQDAAKWAKELYDKMPEEEKKLPYENDDMSSIMWVLKRKIKQNGGLGLQMHGDPHQAHDSVPETDETARDPEVKVKDIFNKFLVVLYKRWHDLEMDEDGKWTLQEEHKPENIVQDSIRKQVEELLKGAGM